MDCDTANPPESSPHSLVPDVDSKAKSIAEEVGIDFELIKPMLTAKLATPAITRNAHNELRLEIASDSCQISIQSTKSPLMINQAELSNIPPETPQPPATPPGSPSESPLKSKHDIRLRSRKLTTRRLKQERTQRPPQDEPTEITHEELVQNRSPRLYNLRGARRPSTQPVQREIWLNKKLRQDCIRERALTKIVIDKYHENSMPTDEHANKILELSKKTQLSQMDKFTYDGRQFIVIAWLSAVRIFEFDSRLSRYFEVRRMPKRYVSFSSNLVTSVHYCEPNFYIAYLANEKTEFCLDTGPAAAYVEVRDRNGTLLDVPFYYSHIIKSIHSSRDFIHVKTVKNVISLHKKTHFNFNPYRVDMSLLTNEPIISLSAHAVNSTHNHLRLLTVTPKELLLSRHDGLGLSLIQCYNFNSLGDLDYKTTLLRTHGERIILLRNSKKDLFNSDVRSRLEFGSLRKFSIEGGSRSVEYFVHERSMEFKYRILQFEFDSDHRNIFLLGRNISNGGIFEYEIGQISLDNLEPIWCTRLHRRTSQEPKFLVHEDNIAVVQDCQHLQVINLDSTAEPSSDQQRCPAVHSNVKYLGTGEETGMFCHVVRKVNSALLLSCQSDDSKDTVNND